MPQRRDTKCKKNIFMMLGTFNVITIPGNCTYVHKTLFFRKKNSFDNKMIKINGIRTTSSYDVIAFYDYNFYWWK